MTQEHEAPKQIPDTFIALLNLSLSVLCGSRLWGKHLFVVTASRRELEGCSYDVTPKTSTPVKNLKENYGNGPPGRKQRHLAQDLLGL